jgi:hypothetical protein
MGVARVGDYYTGGEDVASGSHNVFAGPINWYYSL